MSLLKQSIRWLVVLVGVAVFWSPQKALAQATGTISGTVTDSGGIPVASARVTVDGTTRATATGPNGQFTLTAVPAGSQTVRVRLIGFREESKSVSVSAGQTASVEFKLARAAVELETIVSTGYGTQAKANLTGAAEVIGGEEVTKRPVANISKGLQGAMPGVTASDFGGRPGSDGAQIRIRGVTSLNNSNALIIVDGVVGELNNLDPLDIESVSVLKDAASAAIYGARAANGVIIVKTRRGQNTGGLKISYDAYYASQAPEAMPERVDIRTELETVNRVYTDAGQPAKYTAGYIDSTAKGLLPNTNWLGQIYKDQAPMVDQTVRLSGGNELATLSLSANYFNQQGLLNTENYYKRYTLRANSNFNISKRTTAFANLMLMDEGTFSPNGESDAEFRALHDTPPTQAVMYADGTYAYTGAFNPLAILRERGGSRQRWLTTSMTTAINYQFDNGLRFGGQFQADNKDNRNLNWTPKYCFSDHNNPNLPCKQFSATQSSSTDSRSNNFNFDAQVTGDYERSFGLHSFHLLAGYEQRQSTADNNSAFRGNSYNNDLQLPGNGDASLQTSGGGASQTRIVRQFSRLNYSWNDRYMLEGDVSHDGSSRFGPNKKFGTFPSVSAGWRITEEPWMPTIPGVNDVKFRVSWGKLGNDQIGDYLFQQTINVNSGNYNFNNQLSSGATPGRIANPDIGWETTEQTNGGIELQLLDNRLTFTGDVYKKNTTGILQAVAISSLVGWSAATVNAASVENKGWEAAATWRSSVGEFQYSVSANISNNRNKITDLPGGDQISGNSINRLGEPINSMFGVQAIRIFQTTAEVAAAPFQNANTAPGDLQYKDQNGDGKVDALDRIVMGDRLAHYTYGSNWTASFRNFDLSVLWQGVGKQDVFLDGALIEGPVWENFYATYLLDHWTPENTDAKWPRFPLRKDHNQNAPGSNSWYVRDGHYLALKNLNIGYTLPRRYAQAARLSSARFYIAGSNVFSWYPLKGIVPQEANPGSTRATYYYQTRNWNLGTSLGF